MLKIKRLTPAAILPTRGSPGSAGLDLYSDTDVVVPAGDRERVRTGIAIALQPGTYGRVAPRSGLAWTHGIDVLAGVIDSDYRGEIVVILQNHGSHPFHVGEGDRIAQLIIEKIWQGDPVEVDNLAETDRGAGGFGSTGR